MRASLVWVFFAYKKILGRTETRTRDRMYLGRIRSVRDISRGDRARIATCSLRTPTDRLKANYSVHLYKVITADSVSINSHGSDWYIVLVAWHCRMCLVYSSVGQWVHA